MYFAFNNKPPPTPIGVGGGTNCKAELANWKARLTNWKAELTNWKARLTNYEAGLAEKSWVGALTRTHPTKKY